MNELEKEFFLLFAWMSDDDNLEDMMKYIYGIYANVF